MLNIRLSSIPEAEILRNLLLETNCQTMKVGSALFFMPSMEINGLHPGI